MATESNGFISPEALLSHWQGHRRLTRRVIDAFPDDQLFTFALGGMRPFGALAMEFLSMATPMVRGIGFLQWIAPREPDRQWLYLPSLKRTRQISGGSRTDSFAGTDFSYEDLSIMADVLDWGPDSAAASLKGSETLDGQECDIVELFFFQHHIIVFAALVAAHLIGLVDRLAGDAVDITRDDAVAGFAVQRMEADRLRLRRRRHHRHRAGDERELEIAFPECARRHGELRFNVVKRLLRQPGSAVMHH